MTLDADLAYLRGEGIDRLIDLSAAHESGVAPYDDLGRLHRLIRQRKPFTVLELGTGYSTSVIADALRKNQLEWNALPTRPTLRNRFAFQMFTVETSMAWIEMTRAKLSEELRPFVVFHHSTVKVGTHDGQLCHFYEKLPDIVPDFVYLDGPDPAHVEGSINGLSFQCTERTVMAGDPLLMESTLMPGFFMLVDGRTNNARFLQRNLTRPYKVVWDREGDVTTFELDEERLGRVNILAHDVLA